jgi:hypothetical protein
MYSFYSYTLFRCTTTLLCKYAVTLLRSCVVTVCYSLDAKMDGMQESGKHHGA